MRLFAALEVPAPVAAALHAWATEHASGLRVSRPESLHATLVFLGERTDEEAGRIREALRAAAAPVPALSIGRLAALGRGTALAIDLVDAEGAAAALQARLVTGLAGLHAPDDRRYRPHITVARGDRVRVRGLPAPPDPGTFAATAATLFRSHLGRGPARYEALVSVPLLAGR